MLTRAAVIVIVLAFGLAPGVLLAQEKEQPNPFIPERDQVTFYGTGSVQFTPRVKAGTMATPSPSCMPKSTQVGFKVECLSNSTVKMTNSCRGTMTFYALNLTRTVNGSISGTAETAFMLSLSSPDGAIEGCTLGNSPPVAMGTSNTVTMPSCAVTAEDCAGDAVGAGPNHALTSSAAVTVTRGE